VALNLDIEMEFWKEKHEQGLELLGTIRVS
jgi:hypothetical protein